MLTDPKNGRIKSNGSSRNAPMAHPTSKRMGDDRKSQVKLSKTLAAGGANALARREDEGKV